MNRMQLNSRGGSQPAQYQTYQARQAQQWQQQQQASQFPLYASNATGTPINISQGIVRTECRGIFVNGLNYRARREDIEKHFSKAGDIIRVDLQKDSTSGKSKGNCTIQYARAESAAEAIKIFHGREFMSMRLNVRKDKEATAINAPSAGNARSTHAGRANMEPIIVNGSQVR
jgi:RNA recognition motif-containing protein